MIRVGTFNVENLFDRPKILNLQDSAETTRLLKLTDQLQKLLAKTTYDKPKINELLEELKGFVIVRVDSGKFFEGRSKSKVGAAGKDEWAGAIEFVRDRFSDRQRENTAEMVRSLKADVLCMIEVEGRQALTDFGMEFFKPAERLGRSMLIDSPNDPRGIDIGLAWRSAELGVIRSDVYETFTANSGKAKNVWSRDCLEVTLHLQADKRLTLLCNHFKSKSGGDAPDSQERRKAQATRVSEILQERYDLSKDMVMVLGDLNDTPDSAPLQPLLTTPGLADVFDVVGRPADDRWTYYYGGAPKAKRRTQIDYILVSQKLAGMIDSVNVWRQGMSAVAEGLIPEVQPMDGITGWKNAASDHAAITVDFKGIDLPA